MDEVKKQDVFGGILSQQDLSLSLGNSEKKDVKKGHYYLQFGHFRYLVFDPVKNSTLEVLGKGGVNKSNQYCPTKISSTNMYSKIWQVNF